jgi:predicted esterase
MSDKFSSKSIRYPEPLVVQPTKEHRQTFIVLHGRGSSAQKFSEPFLSHAITTPQNQSNSTRSDECQTIQSSFPHAKFVFPTATLRRAVIYRRSLTHQWFDSWSLDKPEYRQDLQTQGLKETSRFIHSLLQKEIGIIGAPNVILVGLSQGCAASLISLLMWEGEPIAGMIGMCGWLPLREMMAQSVSETHDEENPFDYDEECETTEATKIQQVVDFLKQELEMEDVKGSPMAEIPLQRIPVFLGHGSEDEKVPCELGRKASVFLQDLEVDARWNEYAGLGHWYSSDMLRDMVQFIRTLSSWKDEM